MTGWDLLEPDALRAFAAFAEHRNFTAAAAQLHISQPSLHVKISKLSAALGVSLYQRHGRDLLLTRAGQHLAAYAQDVRRSLKDFLVRLDAGEQEMTIASGRGTLRWVISGAIRRLAERGERVRILAADRDQALDALGAGQADVAVVAFDPPGRQFAAKQIASYPQVLVIGAGHPLAARKRLRLMDLAGLDLVVPPAHRPHRRSLERALLDAGVPWQPVAETDGWDLLVHFASLGVGAAIVNGCVGLPAGLTGIPIGDLPQVRYWAAWRQQRRTRAQAFLSMAHSTPDVHHGGPIAL
jgi:LysR family transcriptional regulator, low CO2-responsive transcriptional regulator